MIVAGPVRERRGVTIVNRIQPKPVAPSSNHHAFIVIVVALHGVALSEGPDIVRVVIHSSNIHYLVRLSLVSDSPASLSGAPHLPQQMRGETVCADWAAEKQRTAFCDHVVDEELGQFGQIW